MKSTFQLPPARNVTEEPLYACEICGKKDIAGRMYSYIISMATTGHPAVATFQCEARQHWGCTPEHGLELAIACMEQHLHPALLEKHAVQEAKGFHRDQPPIESH